ncbi:TPA: hypothetical protein KN209_000930 [Clostridioides difficile]|uniref:Uncharacterized protein n=3 Tax=Clostridioides difficile TaxID=1496 RepID=A0AB74QFE4_CLODI|nr:hypothetical protein [Clostridioides difficile]EQG74434.1 hypothetical protein QKA_3976 [Clostridioides difficile DA00165]OFU06942.1 hypothetical protein HMPREF3081_13965 [Clostridium sp. HMSC19D02]OFU08354.1 hypothetical protein HMPREF3083_04040 [Clostridium sp. HMSC19D07]OFU30111.1 hypothetical protein HMPREF3075_10790 [Clostridium sp. HMSC19B11]AXU84338.1 hypothetical protein CDIF29632_03228 [Clostridioides difficile]
MKLSRKNITMQVLSKFIENNLEKIENVETKANQIVFRTIDGDKKIKIKTSKNYSEGEDPNTYLWTSFSSEELEEDYDYYTIICNEDIEKAVVFTKEELKQHYVLETKKKKNREIDFELYPHFIGRRCIDARVHLYKEPIDITKYVNNYIF